MNISVNHDASTPSAQINGVDATLVCSQQDLQTGIAGNETIICSSNGTTTSTIDLPASSKGEIIVTLNLDDNGSWNDGDLLLNTVNIDTTTKDLDETNNDDTASTLVGSFANIRIEKTGPDAVKIGESITYELTYRNDGSAPAENVTIIDNYNPII